MGTPYYAPGGFLQGLHPLVGPGGSWERCSAWIAGALEFTRGTHTLADVRAAILRGEAKLWPGERCAVVTEVRHYPRLRELHLWLCGGDLEELLAMLPRLESYARQQGCARVTTCGRDGWQRVLKAHGYQPHWHACAKEFAA